MPLDRGRWPAQSAPATRHPTQIASHRGGAFLWPENSLTAFRETLRLPVDQAECDVHLSADGVPMVLHDATLDRTTDASGPIAARGREELRQVRIRGTGGEPVPSLAELAALYRGSPVLLRVEIKTDAAGRPYPDIVARVLAALDAEGMRSRTVLICFQAPPLGAALAAGGLAGHAWLVEARTLRDLGLQGVIAAARAHGFAEVDFPEAVMDAELLGAVRKAGLALGVWGANHEDAIRRMLGLGVDLLATDDPPLALRLRG